MKKAYYCFLLFFFCVVSALAQNTVKGVITESQTKRPLAFASIYFNGNSSTSIIADIDGKFSYTSKEIITSATASYVGYTPTTVKIAADTKNPIDIELAFSATEIQELTINSADNPADAIMRKVIAAKEDNDPENLKSYSCTTYNKVSYDFYNKAATDSTIIRTKKFLKGGHLFMMESVTERKYLKPKLTEEKIIASKVSGLKEASFASTITDLQPFSFYKDNINFLNINYLNPISAGSTGKYRFTLQDTLYTNSDTIYVIHYKPKRNKNFEALTGLLYISTNGYAVQQVTAEPFEKGMIDLKIKQQYTFNKGHWFPEQLRFELIMKNYPNPKTGMIAEGTGYVDNVVMNQDLRKRDFAPVSIYMDENANTKDSLFWMRQRREILSDTENSTYKVLDSLGEKLDLDRVFKLSEKLARGRLGIGVVDLDLKRTFIFNKYEGFRAGLGVYTNEKLFKRLSLGGFFGYGTKDGAWKYGAEAIYTVSKIHDFTITAGYQDNLIEAGNYGYGFTPLAQGYNLRNLIAERFDRVRQERFVIGSRIFRYLKWNAGFTHSKTIQKYTDNAYLPAPSLLPFVPYLYENTEAGINLRYAYNEKIINTMGQNVSSPSEYPVLYLSYYKGLKNVFNGNFNYNKVEAAIEQYFYTKNLGKTSYRLEAGYVDKALPYGLMFTGEGSRDKKVNLVTLNNFQTMYPYEFLSNKYINLFTTHNFGGLLFKTEKFQPWLSLHNNFSIGNLPAAETLNYTLPANRKDRLFAETGLQLDNVLRMNYLNLGYLGIGAGVFYRYGYYALPNANNNWVFKASFSFSIK